MTDYTTLALVKASLSITDSSRDTLLAGKVTAASRSIDRLTGRTFQTDPAATARIFAPRGRLTARDGGQVLLTDDIANTTDLAVATGVAGSTSWATVAAAGYEADYSSPLGRSGPITGLLRVAWGWAYSGQDRIQITARWGWPSVPEDVAEAALILACRLYKRKDSPEGVMGSAEWGVVRVTRTDPDVAAMIAPYKIPGFA